MTKQHKPRGYADRRDGQRLYSPSETLWADVFGDGYIIKGRGGFRLVLQNTTMTQCMEALGRLEEK